MPGRLSMSAAIFQSDMDSQFGEENRPPFLPTNTEISEPSCSTVQSKSLFTTNGTVRLKRIKVEPTEDTSNEASVSIESHSLIDPSVGNLQSIDGVTENQRNSTSPEVKEEDSADDDCSTRVLINENRPKSSAAFFRRRNNVSVRNRYYRNISSSTSAARPSNVTSHPRFPNVYNPFRPPPSSVPCNGYASRFDQFGLQHIQVRVTRPTIPIPQRFPAFVVHSYVTMGSPFPTPYYGPPPLVTRPPPQRLISSVDQWGPRTSRPVVPSGILLNHHGATSQSGSSIQPQHTSTGMSRAEFEEVMATNRAASSSAITRAVSEAAAGDYGSAMERLKMVLALISCSKAAHDERCKTLIWSLEDTLRGIEANARRHCGTKRRRRSRSRSRGSCCGRSSPGCSQCHQN